MRPGWRQVWRESMSGEPAGDGRVLHRRGVISVRASVRRAELGIVDVAVLPTRPEVLTPFLCTSQCLASRNEVPKVVLATGRMCTSFRQEGI